MNKIHIESKKGFTIVELLIVIVVIAILAAISIIAYTGIQDRARYTKMRSDFASIHKAIAAYHTVNGRYPDSQACQNAGGETNYSSYWCGWDQGTGDSFIPGLIPATVTSIPTLDKSYVIDDTYLYQSRASDCTSQGTDEYQLIRFRAGGLQGMEASSANELLMTGGSYDGGVAWGYRSSGCAATGW